MPKLPEMTPQPYEARRSQYSEKSRILRGRRTAFDRLQTFALAVVDLLIGDPAKAKKQLGWEPKVRFRELVKIMTEADLELAKREAQIANLPKP